MCLLPLPVTLLQILFCFACIHSIFLVLQRLHIQYTYGLVLQYFQNFILFVLRIQYRYGQALKIGVKAMNQLYVRYLRVTVLDSKGTGVVLGSFIEQLHTVLLSSKGRGEMDCDHLQHGVASREPFPHHSLKRKLMVTITRRKVH